MCNWEWSSPRALAQYFDEVVATDSSVEQIEQSKPDPKIRYQTISAEEAHFKPQSLDLVTVAQALHWFDLSVFYVNVKRFLKPNGIVAIWGYDFFQITPDLDEILNPYGREFLKDYWSDKNWILIDGYKNIPFPFSKIPTPNLYLRVKWDFHQMKGYLDSWSATQKFKDRNHCDPFDTIKQLVEDCWGDKNQKKQITWKLYVMIGKNL